MSEASGIILCGHGSRDPLWRQPMEAVATRVSAARPGVPVVCAYLEMQQPDLAAAAAEMARLGVSRIRILPMFLGIGKHAREDLPREVERLRRTHRGIGFELRPSVGEDPRVLDLLAAIAAE